MRIPATGASMPNPMRAPFAGRRCAGESSRPANASPEIAVLVLQTAIRCRSFARRERCCVEGKILAVKGLGGFLLACDATNDAAVAELRRRKRRPHKPFALMVRDLAAVKKLCERIGRGRSRAAVIRGGRSSFCRGCPGRQLSPGIAPGDNTLGVMLPYTPLHYLLFSDSPETESEFPALVMTSGNLSEEPIVVSNHEAMLQLGGVADWFLLHNRDIATRVDDSVVRTFEGRERVLRRSRGFVPQTIDLGIELEEVLAFGGELKNTFCLTKGRYAILSQHIGDLENYETMQFLRGDACQHPTHFQGRAARGRLRSAPRLHEHPHGAGVRNRAQDRGAASSCAHRQLHGGEPSARQGYWRGAWTAPASAPTARYGAANFWLRILPASPGGPICAMSCFPAATRRCGSPGAWRSATCAMRSAQQIPQSLECFRGSREAG